MFVDRADAGRRLGEQVQYLRGADVVVLGLPRGGVVVAAEVARALDAPLDVIVVRKLGVPFQPELAMGAIGEGDARVLNEPVVQSVGITEEELAAVEDRERAELGWRSRRFRGNRPPVPLAGRTAVLVDDGVATGSTARVACHIVRAQGARRVVLAVPVAPSGWERRFEDVADELISLSTPRRFSGIGQFYDDFAPTTDEQVLACLRRVHSATDPPPAGGSRDRARGNPDPPVDDPPGRSEDVEVPAGTARLGGRLTVPGGAAGIVVFAHGSGSSRHSPRNRYVADVLNQAGLGTLLLDLLTEGEERNRATVFNIDLLARRLIAAAGWLTTQPHTSGSRLGYFGASTGAAAALVAAARQGSRIDAVVSRGGRPDLAAAQLTAVSAATLLIVGGRDETVLGLNRSAQARLRRGRLVVVPGATHLFDEHGALEQVAMLARDWFVTRLAVEEHSVRS